MVGGDGIYSADFIKLAGATAAGDLATSVGAPVEELASAKEFVANYKNGGYKEAYEAYGGYSYDSAWAIIEPSRRSSTTTAASCPTTPAPRSPRPCRTSPSTV